MSEDSLRPIGAYAPVGGQKGKSKSKGQRSADYAD